MVVNSIKLSCLVRLLEGHEYGGQCVAALDTGVVYSASLDRTLRSWDINTGKVVRAALCSGPKNIPKRTFAELNDPFPD